MRKVDLLALGGVGVLLAGAVAYGQRDPGPESPDLAPLRAAAGLAPCPSALTPDLEGVVLPCLGGGPDVDAGGVAALPLLLNVWGPWCGPCRDEVPDLQAFAEKAAGKVQVVGVMTEDTEVSALSFAKAYGMTYANVVDDDGIVRSRYGVGTPLTILVGADGAVTKVVPGEIPSLAAFEALAQEHLGVVL